VDGLMLRHHDVGPSFSINVVGYDAVVICHPIFSLYIFAVESSNVHGIEDGFSRFYPNGRHLSCMGHLQQGFMVLSAPPAATGFDGNTSPITTIGISLEIVPLPFQKVNHHCLGIVTGASGLTITLQAILLIGICTAISRAA